MSGELCLGSWDVLTGELSFLRCHASARARREWCVPRGGLGSLAGVQPLIMAAGRRSGVMCTP